MMTVPLLRSLLLSAALAATLANANIFTSPQHGMQSTATSATFIGRRIFPRQDASGSSSVGTASSTVNSTSMDAAPSTTTSTSHSSVSASNTATASSAVTAADASATSVANGCMSDAASSCVNGMPVSMTSKSPTAPVCSELRLLQHDTDADPLFFATNLNVSAGWLQVYIPHGPPGDKYVFTLAVADGDCAIEEYQSAPFAVMPAL
ncbi:hypothetical protein VTO73DRAFT_13660 [Trametes versicolor]